MGPPRAGSRVRERWAAVAALAGALLAALTAAAPWWYDTSSTLGASTTVSFYPGGDLRVTSGGGGGSTPYGTVGLASVGLLYEAILGAVLLVTLVALAAVVLLTLPPQESSERQRRDRLGRRLIGVAVLVAVLCAAVVPLAQPQLFRSADVQRACSDNPPGAGCQGFWGSSSAAGTDYVWGGAAGYWLDLVAAGFLGLAYALPHRTARAELRVAASRGAGVTAPVPTSGEGGTGRLP